MPDRGGWSWPTAARVSRPPPAARPWSRLPSPARWCGATTAPMLAVEDLTSGYGDSQVLFGMSRSEEHTSELQSLMRISYAVFCLKKKRKHHHTEPHNDT